MKGIYSPLIVATLYLIICTAAITIYMGKDAQIRQTAVIDRAKQVEDLSTLCGGSLLEFTIEDNKITATCGE